MLKRFTSYLLLFALVFQSIPAFAVELLNFNIRRDGNGKLVVYQGGVAPFEDDPTDYYWLKIGYEYFYNNKKAFLSKQKNVKDMIPNDIFNQIQQYVSQL